MAPAAPAVPAAPAASTVSVKKINFLLLLFLLNAPSHGGVNEKEKMAWKEGAERYRVTRPKEIGWEMTSSQDKSQWRPDGDVAMAF